MSGTQVDNIQILDASSPFLTRVIEASDHLQISASLEVQNDVLVTGDLTVTGTTTTVKSEVVNINDNHLFLNQDYTTAVAQTGGLVVNYLPTATADTVNGAFTAGVAATSNPTVVTTGAATFSVSDLIMVSGANEPGNDGLYEVLTHVGTTLTIRGIGITGTVEDFTQNQFTTDATVQGTITKVNVSVLRSATNGDWEVAKGSATGLVFTYLATGSAIDLQDAYDNTTGSPASIITNATHGSVVIGGDQSLQVTATGGLNVDTIADFDVTTFDVQMTGTNGFSIDGTAASNVSVTSGNLTLSTITAGDVLVNSAAEVDLTSAGLMDFNAGANLDIDVTGTFDMLSTGVFSIDGTGASNVTADTGNLTLSTTTSGDVLVNSAAEVDLTSAGLMDFNAGANLDIDVTGTFDMLSSGVFSIDGTGASNVTATSGNLTLSTITSGDVVVNSVANVDIDGVAITADATAGISLDAALASNFTITANTANAEDLVLSATNAGAGSGNVLISADDEVDLTSGGLMDVNAGANLDIDVTGTYDMLSTGTFSIDGTGASNVTADTGNLTLSTTTSGDVVVNSVANVDIDGVAITADATAGISLDAALASNFTITANTANPEALVISATNAGAGVGNVEVSADGEIDLTSTGLMDFNAGANLDIDVTGTYDMLSTGAFSIDGTGASNVTATSGNLTLSTATTGSLILTSVQDMDVNIPAASATAFNIGDGANTYINIDSTAAAPQIDLDEHINLVEGAGVEVVTSVNLVQGELVSFTTAGQLKKSDADTGTLIDGLCIGVSRGAATATNPAQIFSVNGSLVPVLFGAAPAAIDNGKPVYVSVTAGQASLTPPAPPIADKVFFLVGYLQGGNGITSTPKVLWNPQYLSKGASVS